MKQISVFDMYKIGIGPSSSHTLGPWVAARMFVECLRADEILHKIDRVEINLFGSLALTGKGHGTDIAVQMGLEDRDVKHIDSATVDAAISKIATTRSLNLAGERALPFDPDRDIPFHFDTFLEFHSNGLRFIGYDADGEKMIVKTYFSIGGGFVSEYDDEEDVSNLDDAERFVYPIDTADELLAYCENENKTISEIVMANELTIRSKEEIHAKLLELWEVMSDSAWSAIQKDGVLPGGLDVSRRSKKMVRSLMDNHKHTSKEEWLNEVSQVNYDFSDTVDWISAFALAINEENASFGRVVTAPTNGAAGVVPTVLFYHLYLCKVEPNDKDIIEYLLVSGEIGSIFKKGATISAAMGGCQAEIGVSSAMAAAGLTHVRGGSPAQCVMAAEIAMEHHLGMTCDPIKGLVQVPCIERNSIGAIKAISASNLAMKGDPKDAKVTLDEVVQSMWKTAQAMHSDYKETSKGGLASTVGLSEC